MNKSKVGKEKEFGNKLASTAVKQYQIFQYLTLADQTNL